MRRTCRVLSAELGLPSSSVPGSTAGIMRFNSFTYSSEIGDTKSSSEGRLSRPARSRFVNRILAREQGLIATPDYSKIALN